MVTNSQINAAPGKIDVVGGRTLTVRPLRERDYAELEAWVQDRHIAVTRRNVKGLPAKQQQHLLDKAFTEAAEMHLTSPSTLAALVTPEGAFLLLYMAIRRDHPDIKLEDVPDLLSNPAHLDAVMTKITDVEKRATPHPKRRKQKQPTRKRIRRL